MNVETITMEPEAALEQLKAYKAKLKGKMIARANTHMKEEYQTAIDTLRQLGNGYPILDIEEAIKNAPVDEMERPRLAIARADCKQVQFCWRENKNDACFTSSDDDDDREHLTFWNKISSKNIELNMGRQHHFQKLSNWEGKTQMYPATIYAYSLVPLIPPSVKLSAKAENFHILWEVEKWSEKETKPEPDKDPYLLRRINSTLFAVVDEWELTELERLVMKHRVNV